MESDDKVIEQYNYDTFTRENLLRWTKSSDIPGVGEEAPDFPLWQMDGQKTSLSEIWSAHLYTVVEFGSFT